MVKSEAQRTAGKDYRMKHEKSFDKYPAEELKVISQKGGIISDKARRKKRQDINKEKLQRQANQELVHEEVLAIRRAAKELLAASRIDRYQRG